MAADPDRWRYGYDLCAQLGMQAGSMYPILIRLADRGLLETSWETERPGRPARHLYRLTGTGHAYATSTAATTPAAAPAPRPSRPRLASA
ncbi:MAG: PadR family transcriptional regulator [Sciscionella sp.]